MNNFQRLVAIPQEQYVTMMETQKPLNPLAQQMQVLEQRFQQNENTKDPYRQLVMQSDTLDKMMNLKEQMRNSISISSPKPYVNRAQALFRNLEAFIKFNERGELITDDDRVIPHSRIEDLVQHAVRDRRRNMTPTGWDYFAHILKHYNVPKSLLNRETLDELEEVQTRSTNLSSPNIKQRVSRLQKPKIFAPKQEEEILLIPKREPHNSRARSQPDRKAKSNISFLKEY